MSSPPRAADRPGHFAPPAKKPPADWHALAGALGIEIPPESEPLAPRKDPVAELFGFPSQPQRTREQEEEERRQRREERAAYQDEEDERVAREDDRGRGETEQRYERPVGERSDETGSFQARDRYESRGPQGDEGSRERGQRRRRRGGRGRGRADDRSSRHGDSRQPHRRETSAESPPTSDFGDEREEFEVLEDRPDRPVEVDETRARYDDGPRRRRRGRRGGQRSRSDRVESAASEPRSQTMPSEMPVDDELELEFEALGETRELPAEESAIDAAAASESEQLDADSTEESHELHGGKGSVRDILTWTDAIGIIIDSNLQTRSRTPHASHPQRGSRRGRGRRGG